MNPNTPIISLFRQTEIWNTLNKTLEEMTNKFSLQSEVTNKINEKFDQVTITSQSFKSLKHYARSSLMK